MGRAPRLLGQVHVWGEGWEGKPLVCRDCKVRERAPVWERQMSGVALATRPSKLRSDTIPLLPPSPLTEEVAVPLLWNGVVQGPRHLTLAMALQEAGAEILRPRTPGNGDGLRRAGRQPGDEVVIEQRAWGWVGSGGYSGAAGTAAQSSDRLSSTVLGPGYALLQVPQHTARP